MLKRMIRPAAIPYFTPILAAAVFGILVTAPIFAQEKYKEAEDYSPDSLLIKEIVYEIDGRTREGALSREMKLKTDRVYEDYATLQAYLDREVQELINLRIFAYVYSRIEFLSDVDTVPQPVRIVISIKDTWTFFPFLLPSTDGDTTVFNLAVVDKNFFGTITEFQISADIGIGTDPLYGGLEIPSWGVYITWAGITFTQWQIGAQVSQSHNTVRKFDADVLAEDYNYDQTAVILQVRYEFARVRNLYYYIIPSVAWRYNYEVRVDSGDVEYEYFRVNLGQAIDYNRIDWDGFFRRGWALGLLNNLWGSEDGRSGQLKTAFTTRLSGHIISGKVNPNARLSGYFAYNHIATNLGAFLRGVRDNTMYGDKGLFLNTGLQFKLWEWRWLEPHLQPFVDVGFVAKDNQPVDWTRDFHVGIGSEIIFFFPTVPSAQLVAFAGFDAMVPDWSSSAKWEVGISFDISY